MWVIVVISFVYAYKSFAIPAGAQEVVYLTKVYHHTNGSGISPVYLEMGNVIFYFSKKILPTVLKKQLLNNGWQEYQFFLKQVAIPDEAVTTMVERINNSAQDHYNISLTVVRRQSPGLIFTLQYDPQKVTFSYESLFSITTQHGLVFRFINKTLQEEIAKNVQSKRVTCVAWHNKKPRIVIDAGHGGIDRGAISSHGLQEKDLCLALSNQVMQYLETFGYEAYVTRSDDSTLLLDERCKKANAIHADFFVSIHANAAPNKKAHGIETFYAGLSQVKPLFSTHHPTSAAFLVQYSRGHENKSYEFASTVHNVVCAQMARINPHVADRGVKKAASHILLGTRMPAILIEVGFLTNDIESTFLASIEYQKKMAFAIAQGIQDHIEKMNVC